MRIILLKDVRKVGRKDEVKDVADGYAINFLLPRNLAVTATPDRLAAFEKKQAAVAQAHAVAEAAIDGNIRSLEGRRIALSLRATPKGGLFKSVTTSDIISSIREQANAEIPEDAVVLEEPIKTTGEHRIRLRSNHASAELMLVITPVS